MRPFSLSLCKTMLTLFVRTIIIYIFMFAIMRLMGKRQLSDMQPFDLVVTLLIANLASAPLSDPAVPLLYGVVTILALFVMQRLVSHLSLKSEKMRKVICGSPLVVIAKGIVREDVMRSANYTLNDLSEQLRDKDVFAFSKVEYAILETNGSLSVLLKSQFQQPTIEDMSLETSKARPALLIITDGKLHRDALEAAGLEERWLSGILSGMGFGSVGEVLFASLDGEGMLHVQGKQDRKKKTEPKCFFYQLEGTK